MRQGLILPQIAKRKPLKQSQTSQNKKDELIKAFEHKLQIHQQEIEKNNNVIQAMTSNFDIIRSQLLKEKALNEELSVTNKRIKEDLDRLVRSSRGSKGKLDELERLYAKQLESGEEMQKKLSEYKQRESKDQSDKSYQQKRNKKLEQQNFNLSKINSQLTKEIEQLKHSYNDKLEDQDNVSKVIEKYLEEMKELKEDRNRLKNLNDMNEARLARVNGDHQLENARLEEENKRLRSEKNTIHEEKVRYEGQISQFRRELGRMEISSDRNIKELIEKNKQQQREMQQKQKKLQDEIKGLKQQSKRDQDDQRISSEKIKVKLQKLQDLMKLSTKIDQGQKLLVDNLQCQFCKQMLKEPVTIIPCGHCFCLGCKKGYQKQCSCCGPKVKIEALYRNQLLDDVLAIYNVVKEIKILLR